LSHFQVRCESAVVAALATAGFDVSNREVAGSNEHYVRAGIAGTPWRVWIYPDGAEVSSDQVTLVRLEQWDARTPEDFIVTFVERVLAGVRGSRDESV